MNTGRKLAFGLLVGLLVLFGAEVALRLFNLLPPPTAFVERSGPDCRMARFAGNDFGEEWPIEKPAGTFRVVITGGSTSLGFPWHPRSSFGLRLAAMLRQALPGRRIEVIHAGRMSAWSGEIREIVSHALKYQPDLVVVYSGQNEFISLKRRPTGAAGWLTSAAGSSRLLSALAGGVIGLTAGDEEEIGLVYPVPPSMKPGDFDRALREYRENLAAIGRDCRAAGVPLALSTMVYNLSDWPPSESAAPAAVDHLDRVPSLRYDAYQASRAVEAGHLEQGEKLALPGSSAGYSLATFWLGAVRLARLEPWQRLPGASPEAEAARGLLFRAASEEARAVVAHRAVPEINAIVREVALEQKFFLADFERDFLARSLAPGFDLFEDQCHPNLVGQQTMAETLLALLQANGLPAPAGQWRPLPAWDEAAYRRTQGLDDPFIHRVELTMAVFLGIKKELPFGSAETRRRLKLAQDADPADPLPALIGAVVSAHYPNPGPAYGLAEYYRRDPELVARLVRERLTPLVELKGDRLTVRTQPEFFTPPLGGMIRREFFHKEKVDFPSFEGLDARTVVFELGRDGRASVIPPLNNPEFFPQQSVTPR